MLKNVHRADSMCDIVSIFILFPFQVKVVARKTNLNDPWPAGTETWPAVCPLLTAFVKSPAAANWPTKNVTVSAPIRTFINLLLDATEILNPIVYRDCYDLETAQRRVTGREC